MYMLVIYTFDVIVFELLLMTKEVGISKLLFLHLISLTYGGN